MGTINLPPSYEESHYPQESLRFQPQNKISSSSAPIKAKVIAVQLVPNEPFIKKGILEQNTMRKICKLECLMFPFLVPLMFLALLVILYTSVASVRLFIDHHQFIIWVPIVSFLAMYIVVVFLIQGHYTRTHVNEV